MPKFIIKYSTNVTEGPLPILYPYKIIFFHWNPSSWVAKL